MYVYLLAVANERDICLYLSVANERFLAWEHT